MIQRDELLRLCVEIIDAYPTTPAGDPREPRILILARALKELLTRPEPQGERINTPCPACGFTSLFIANGGWLTCSRLECKDPTRINHLVKREGFVTVPKSSIDALLWKYDGLVQDKNASVWRLDTEIDRLRTDIAAAPKEDQ